MLSIAHAATGAFIATKIGNPLLSAPIILLSHYAQDAIHHYDAGTGLSSGQKTRRTAFILGSLDLLLAALTVIIMYPDSIPIIRNSSFIIQNQAPLWGALLGLLPDFLESPRNFLHYEPHWLRPINRFHALFHHSIKDIAAGLAPQVILLVTLWILH